MPMTYAQAVTRAVKLARKNSSDYHVVWDSTYYPDYPRNACYDAASDYDLETFYAGINPVATFLPDGAIAE